MRLAQLRDIYLKMIVKSICRAAATRHIPIDYAHLLSYLYRACCAKRAAAPKAAGFTKVYFSYNSINIDCLSCAAKDAANSKELLPYSVDVYLTPGSKHEIHVTFAYFDQEANHYKQLRSKYKLRDPLHIWNETYLKDLVGGLRILVTN